MLDRSQAALTALLSLALLGAGDEFSDGVAAYRAGRFEEALAAFAAAEKAAGPDASAELHYNCALAALRAGNLAQAESAAKRAAERGGARFGALRDFLLGNTAFVRSRRAAALASSPGLPPAAFDGAIAQALSAARSWRRAATSRPDWPAARRNAERALLEVRALRAKKAAAARRRNPKKVPQPRALPDQPSQEQRRRKVEERPDPQREEGALTPDQVKALLERLATMQREKRALREKSRRARNAALERDW